MIVFLKKYQLMIMTALAVFFMSLAKAFHLGRKAEKHKQIDDALKTAATRLEVENEVNRKGDSDVRAELSRWVRSK